MAIKKQLVLGKLVQHVKGSDMKKGDKLPAERDLAELFDSSRTTIRDVVRTLEERGVVNVRRGSGIYLKKDADMIFQSGHDAPVDHETLVKNQLETGFLVYPIIIGYGALSAGDDEIAHLQKSVVKLSQAILSRRLESILGADMEFNCLVARLTRNVQFVEILESFARGNIIFWEYFTKADEFINNTIFAGYVGIVNAIKKKDAAEATNIARKNISDICEWFNQNTDIDVSELLETMDTYIGAGCESIPKRA
jgi:GntR family transcriptional repressor for pyruvate dehydrogenase complex